MIKAFGLHVIRGNMKLLNKLFFVVVLVFFSISAYSQATDSKATDSEASQFGLNEEHIKISESRAVAYKYVPAEKGKPTIVLLNGLIYPLVNWTDYVAELSKKGYGVLLVAYSTQPESLRYTSRRPYFVVPKLTVSGWSQTGLEIEDLADDVMAVVNHLNIDKFHLQPLSFGSIVGSEIVNSHKDRVESVTFVSPAVMPAHRYTPYGESRHTFYLWQNQINFNPFYVPDFFYDLELYQTMSLILGSQHNTQDIESYKKTLASLPDQFKGSLDFYKLVRTLTQPQPSAFDLVGISYDNFFSGVYQMARATKYYDLKDEAEKNWPKTNLIISSEEEGPLKNDQLTYWRARKAAQANGTFVEMLGAPHAIPGAHPIALATVVESIYEGQNARGDFTYSVTSSTWGGDLLKNTQSASNSCSAYMQLGL